MPCKPVRAPRVAPWCWRQQRAAGAGAPLGAGPVVLKDAMRPPCCMLQMNVERLQKMAGVVRTGGKGTVRRCVPQPVSQLAEEMQTCRACERAPFAGS